MPLEALIRGAFFSLDYIHVIMTITTLFFAYFLVWAAGANGFVNQQMPRVVSTSALLRKEWDDLAPPFNRGQSSDVDCKDEWEDKQENVTHFCFLVHGHRGYSKVHCVAVVTCVAISIRAPLLMLYTGLVLLANSHAITC